MSNNPSDDENDPSHQKNELLNRFDPESFKRPKKLLAFTKEFNRSLGIEVEGSRMRSVVEKRQMKNQDSYENKSQTSQSLKEDDQNQVNLDGDQMQVDGNQEELKVTQILVEEGDQIDTDSNNGPDFELLREIPSCFSDRNKDASNTHAYK